MISQPAYTWFDVQIAFHTSVDAWPDELISARAYWDGVLLEVSEGTRIDALDTFLRNVFGPAWRPEQLAIALRRGPQKSELLPLNLQEVVSPRIATPPPRSFGLPDVARRRPERPPGERLQTQLFAWHSFKGGVGRTTSAVTFARQIAKEEGTRVLLIDMDFEAPGITWMTGESRLPQPPAAMSDLLALIHSALPERRSEAYDVAASLLRDSIVDGLTVVPAIRPHQRTLEIRPEHLERGTHLPLAEVIDEIATRLSATHAIIDLRAGRSELAASLLFDSRVHRVLVTTRAGQSIRGVREVLADIRSEFPRTQADPPITIVLSKISDEDSFSAARDAILADLESEPGALRFSCFRMEDSLTHLPLDWSQVVDATDAARAWHVDDLGVDIGLNAWVREACAALQSERILDESVETLDERRRALELFCARMVTAEASARDGALLDTGFLRNLVDVHRARLPTVVAEGSKGSGKTFTFMKMVAAGTWRSFGRSLGQEVDVDGQIVPITWSKNLATDAQALIAERFGGMAAKKRELLLSQSLDAARADRSSVTEWRDWWLDRMDEARTAAGVSDNGVYVVDGLEDLLPSVHVDAVEQMCLRALLQEVMAWFQASEQPTGLVVFVRSDYVRAAVPQNTEQFRHIYQPFRLLWNRREALRLVWWLAHSANVLTSGAGSATFSPESLVGVWGRKLGSDESREGITDTWVLDALSTRIGEVQARDLVRLVETASGLSVEKGWPDRLLAPQAIRDALQRVGRLKIGEISEEDPELGRALAEFNKVAGTLRVPFKVRDLPDESIKLALLQLESAGIAWRDGEEYWLVSLYRKGIGMLLQHGRREKVLK